VRLVERAGVVLMARARRVQLALQLGEGRLLVRDLLALLLALDLERLLLLREQARLLLVPLGVHHLDLAPRVAHLHLDAREALLLGRLARLHRRTLLLGDVVHPLLLLALTA